MVHASSPAIAAGNLQQAANSDRPGRRARDRYRFLLGTLLTLAALAVGWLGRDVRNISAGEGLGYWLGILGGTLMLTLLLYSVRKRVPWLRTLGATRHWFRMHMTLGIVGPLVILYHSNFQVGSVNSQVALYCTLIVAASGVVGRYFYAQIHHGLYGPSTSLRALVATAEASEETAGNNPALNGEAGRRLAALAARVLDKPETLGQSAWWPVWFGLRTRWAGFQIKRLAYQNIDELAGTSAAGRAHRSRLRRAARLYVGKRLGEIRRVAQFRFFEKLFSLWHVVHVPFFLMMVISAIVHVVAVHLY